MTNQQTIAVKLKSAAERHVKKGHPWIYSDSIIKESKTPSTGDKAIIFDQKKNNFLAIGLYDTESPIRIKILQSHKSTSLGKDWFYETISAAFEKRKPLLDKGINGYRLINGENDSLPSLIVDVYQDVVVIKLYSLIWMQYLEEIKEIIIKIISPKAIVLRCSRNIERQLKSKFNIVDGDVIFGSLTSPEVVIDEYGVKFKVNVLDGHKTGYFLDHRDNRKKVGELSKGKSVLDVFSYAGGFSMHALVGGGKVVTSIDISKHALELAKENAKINGGKDRHLTIAGDAFKVLDSLIMDNTKYDLIIIDPPSFAKQNSEIEGAIYSYKRLTERAVKLIGNNGLLVLASCSARVTSEDFFDAVESVLEDSDIDYRILEKTFNDIDHPVTFPEGAYLKCGYYKVI